MSFVIGLVLMRSILVSKRGVSAWLDMELEFELCQIVMEDVDDNVKRTTPMTGYVASGP
jgi:hypothetical protein